MIKDIVKNLKLSSTLKMNEVSRELETQGKEIFKFGFGQSPFNVPEDVVFELKNNAFQKCVASWVQQRRENMSSMGRFPSSIVDAFF